MSRTDAHRPARVWLADEPQLVHERHDHTRSACPLADGGPLPVDAAAGCRRELDWRVPLCGCPMCSGALWRDADRGARRTAERILTRAAARGADDAELERLEATVEYRSR